MKNYILTITFSLLSNMMIACSVAPISFCETTADTPDDVILTGIVIGVDDDGIDVEVIDILRGEESRTVIRVWDGTDFDCNGLWSMTAASLGSVGDSLVLKLPVIDSLENVWDVLGDYRRPDYFGPTNSLIIEQGKVKGFIKGVPMSPQSNGIYELDYNEFTNKWLITDNCDDFILDDNQLEISNKILINNPVADLLHLKFQGPLLDIQLEIFDAMGRKVKPAFLLSTGAIDVANLSEGIYYITFRSKEQLLKTEKIIKI